MPEDQLYLCNTSTGRICVVQGKRPPVDGFRIQGMVDYEDEARQYAAQLLDEDPDDIFVQAVGIPFVIDIEHVKDD